MYLDSNVLLARIRNNTGEVRVYAEAALKSGGGLVLSDVLIEVLAKAESLKRIETKAKGEEFGKVASSEYRKKLASEILSWHSTGVIVIPDSMAIRALEFMNIIGLDYVDCLLIQTSYTEKTKVATSDKEMCAALGSFRWVPST